MSDVLRELTEEGVSVWLDDISRDRLRTGNLEMLIRDFQVRGVTSNPTIFAHALSTGDAYDEQAEDLKIRGVSVEEASRMITTYDIRWACDVLRPAYEETRGQPTTPPRPSPRPSSCGGWSTGRTCSSRSRRPLRASPRSPRRWRRASA